MSDPRYVPKAYAVDPTMFGKFEHITWIEVPEEDFAGLAELWAARFQHQVAFAIRIALRRMKLKPANYATSSRTGYDRFLKVLRGDTIMRLEDLARAQKHLKLKFAVEAPH